MKNIRTFDGFVNESKTEEVVVDKKVKDILGKIFNKEFKAKYLKDTKEGEEETETGLDSYKELVDLFIKGTTFKDLKDEKGVSEITLPRLLKKFILDRLSADFDRTNIHRLDKFLADITSHFKKLNGDNTTVIIKK